MSARSSALARAAVLVLVGAVGCINVFWTTEARSLRTPALPAADYRVRTPVKAHLVDGSTVVFRRGVMVQRTALVGDGQAYALLSDVAVPRGSVPLDSVVGVETFEGRVLSAPTIVTSVAATALGALGTVAILKAVFGSCPTVYADTDTGSVLEAEGFSYAIAPLLEHRDLDPLRARPGADGAMRLELRNEALETHFLNHVEVVAARHPQGTRVVADQQGRPVVVGALATTTRATDRVGRDVRGALRAADGDVYATAASVVSAARPGDLDDWIDLEADGLPPGDSVAVVLRLRNSLLNTVLLYEGMLGGRDAMDWLAGDLDRIAGAVDLSRWYVRTMGMRATVDAVPLPARRGAYDGHARLGDVGPIAFRDVALVLPRPAPDARAVRVRLRFVADNWRVDAAAIAGSVARPAVATLSVTDVVVPRTATGSGPAHDTAAVSALSGADDRYLETSPGQRMTLVFARDAARAHAGDTTTHLIAWQGWYREWVRGAWLAQPTRTTPFVPGDSAVLVALRRWSERRSELERAFHASRVPVR